VGCWVLLKDMRAATDGFLAWMKRKGDGLLTLSLGCGADTQKCDELKDVMSAEDALLKELTAELNDTMEKRPRLLPFGCNTSFIPAFLLDPDWNWDCYNTTLRTIVLMTGGCSCRNYAAAARNNFEKFDRLMEAKFAAMRQIVQWSNCSCVACNSLVSAALASDVADMQLSRAAFSRSVLEVQLPWSVAAFLLAVTALTVVACVVIFSIAVCVWGSLVLQTATWMLLAIFCGAALWCSGTVIGLIGFGGIGQTRDLYYYAINRAGVMCELVAMTIFFILWIDAIFGVVYDSARTALAVKVGICVWSACLAVLGIAMLFFKFYSENVLDVFFTVLYGSLLLECTAMVIMALAGRAQLKDDRSRSALGRMTVAIGILLLSFALRFAFTIPFELLYDQSGRAVLYYNLGISLPMALSSCVLLVVVALTYYKGRTDASRSETASAERKRDTTENLLPFDDSEASGEYDSERSYRSSYGDKIPAAYDI
jgi:hypothetical protein